MQPQACQTDWQFTTADARVKLKDTLHYERTRGY